jgi:PAS domain S-box-containing protein
LAANLLESLPEQRDLLYLLFNQLSIGIFIKDIEGRYLFVNAWLCRYHDATLEEFIGKTADEFAARKWASDQASEAQEKRKVLTDGANHHKLIVETGQTVEAEERHEDPDGKERFFHVLKGPLRSADGNIIGSQGILLDITERKRAEERFASEHEMLQALMNYSTDAIYFKDRDSRFTRCSESHSRSWREALARRNRDAGDGAAKLENVESAVGKSDFDFFGQEHAQEAYDDEQQIIRTGRPIIAKTEKENWLDGSVTWALTSKMPLFNHHGEIVGTFGISKDITAIKQAEAKVEELHKELLKTSREAGMAEVATSVLHNVGNVLNSVNVSATLLVDQTKKSSTANLGKAVALLNEHTANIGDFIANDPKGKQLPNYFNRIFEQLSREQQSIITEIDSLRENIEHIKEIVAMQQSYARVCGVAETVKVTELVEDALRMNSGALVRHEVALARDYSEVPPITVEKHKVLQVLVNIIRNAKYACDESGRTDKQITLKIAGQGGRIQISVIDNGVGIPPENKTRIFNHGFTTRKDGHGFGLHSGALAATELGGTLTAHSDGIGKGATFTLDLPTQPPNTAAN